MARTEYDGIEELIEDFTFRENASIKIPKRIRRRAFTLQVDIEIVSVAKVNYKNFKSNPANGFYGYAVLVQRDYADLIIPLEQPRQRIYYHINDMAHTTWYNLYLFLLWIEERKYFYDDRLNLVDIAVGVTSPDVTIQCPVKPIWQETTLREIYIECDKGTQFKIEISYWQAKPMEIGDCAYDGTSGIVDGDKDDGMPEDGAQPQNAPNPSQPFKDLPPASSNAALGDLANPKGNKLNDSNPDNEAIPPLGKFGIVVGWSQSCRPSGEPLFVAQKIRIQDLRDTDRILFTLSSPPNNCFQDTLVIATNERTGERYSEFFAGGGGFFVVGGNAPSISIIEYVNDGTWLN